MVHFHVQMLHKQIVVTKDIFSQRSPGSASMVRTSYSGVVVETYISMVDYHSADAVSCLNKSNCQ